MCTSKRWITNQYTHERILVKCGHCPSCLQEKANRYTQKIKDNAKPGFVDLFVTLTYDRSSAPYIKESDLKNLSEDFVGNSIAVYREFKPYRKKNSDVYFRHYGEIKLGDLPLKKKTDLPFFYKGNKKHNAFKSLHYRKGHVGIVYFPDVQNFEKRLRTNLIRNFNYDPKDKIKLFKCGEYGETTNRPHFHLLVQVPQEDVQTVRLAIYASWPFSRLSTIPRSCEIARDSASYVSSYVNCNSYIHSFFQKNFMPKHSHSKGYGMAREQYTLDEVLKKVDSGDLRVMRLRNQNGVPVVYNIPIPKYVLNKYFPIFKGFSRLADTPLVWLQRGCRDDRGKFHLDFSRFGASGVQLNFEKYQDKSKNFGFLTVESEELRKIDIRLTSACDYYMKITGKSQHDYLIDFQRVWTCYKATIFKEHFEDPDIEMYELYDNLADVCHQQRFGHIYDDIVRSAKTLNPNEFPSEVRRTVNLTDLFKKKDKSKKVFNRYQVNKNQFKCLRDGLF